MQDLPVFAFHAGFSPAEWQEATTAWHAKVRTVRAGDVLFAVGDKVREVYVVTRGRVHLVVDDYWGNRSILSVVDEGHIFGAAYAFGDVDAYPMSAVAVTEGSVLSFPIAAYRASEATHPALFYKAQRGFLSALAGRAAGLIHTIEQVKQRTLRGKILAYLTYRSRLAGRTDFDVDLTREQMADFLAVDRAALCRELSALRREGVLDYRKGHFRLYLPDES